MIRAVLYLLALLSGSATGGAIEADPVTDVFSRDGVLSLTLVAQGQKVRLGGMELDGATYNGLYSGPVLHVHPGDVMRLHLINHLSLPTNLHFHGIRSTPTGNGDNPHLVVGPGEAFDYEVRIPANQPPGVLWFHPHVHRLSERGTMAGLSGTILVEDRTPEAVPTRLFVLKDMTFDDDTGNATIDNDLHGIVQSINGALLVTETMRSNETQLWRFANESADRALHISLDGHHFVIVAQDDDAVPMPREAQVLDIAPGGRVQVLVEAGTAGQYMLRAQGVMTGVGPNLTQDRVIGRLDVTGDAIPQPPSYRLPQAARDLRNVGVDEARTISFTQSTERDGETQRFFIDGRQFDAERMDIRVPLGNIEDWTIRNDSDDMHVFHIHQLSFQVVEVNGEPVPFQGYLDTVRVPERGSVKLRMPFTDPQIVGRFVFHCHVLKHEDGGMMANIAVYDPHPPSLLNRLQRWYLHVVWWWHGIPWSQCGFAEV